MELYEILRLIWWVLLGVLFIGIAVMNGHDMGVSTLIRFVGKNDNERRVAINSVAPHWDGNQVWIITGGGAIFAAWPLIYATAFSGFYWAMLIVLWSLFFRPVGFDYRSKIDNPKWRNMWDWGLFIGGTVPPLIFGVAFGNLLLGVPFHYDDMMVSHYTGSFWALLNPFALLCGVVASAMVIFHGAVFLALRTEGDIQKRALKTTSIFLPIIIIAFSVAGVCVATMISGYQLVPGTFNPAGLSEPTTKEVIVGTGAWMQHYKDYPITIIIPVLAYVGFIGAWLLAKGGKLFAAFWSSALGIAGVILTAGASMFPFMMPSSSSLSSSLTVWDASSSEFTLTVMTVVALIFVPIMLIYTSWAYYVMRGKVTVKDIEDDSHSLY